MKFFLRFFRRTFGEVLLIAFQTAGAEAVATAKVKIDERRGWTPAQKQAAKEALDTTFANVQAAVVEKVGT